MGFGIADVFIAFIAFSTAGWLINNWIRARHGYPLIGQWDGKAERTDTKKNAALRAENARLVERLEASEDRIAVLERIVTDRSYEVAAQIEALNDRRPNKTPLPASAVEERN